MPARYRTLAARRRAELRERGSRFIASLLPAADEAEARARIEAVRREFPDATHHAWAARLATAQGALERSSDAGEPRGTAGPPILQALRSAGLLNVVAVVARYFGGTKLGKGGLARAYREAARAALEGAAFVEAVPIALLALHGPVERDGEVRHLLARHAGRVSAAAYEESGLVRHTVELPAASVETFVRELQAATRGSTRARPAARRGGRGPG